MKTTALLLTVSLALSATSAEAACYADYKAKQDDPLRLHYGVARIEGPCQPEAARRELAQRLASSDWTLLNILSLFDESGLPERKDSAGPNYLRY